MVSPDPNHDHLITLVSLATPGCHRRCPPPEMPPVAPKQSPGPDAGQVLFLGLEMARAPSQQNEIRSPLAPSIWPCGAACPKRGFLRVWLGREGDLLLGRQRLRKDGILRPFQGLRTQVGTHLSQIWRVYSSYVHTVPDLYFAHRTMFTMLCKDDVSATLGTHCLIKSHQLSFLACPKEEGPGR